MPNSRFCIGYRCCSSHTCLHNFPYFSQNSISYSNPYPLNILSLSQSPSPNIRDCKNLLQMKKYIAVVLSVIKYIEKCYRNGAMSENIFEDHRKNGLNSKLKHIKAILSRRFGDHVRVIGGFVPYVGSNCQIIWQKSWHKSNTPKKNVKPFILNRDHILT